MLITTLFSPSLGMYTSGQGILFTVALKNELTALKYDLIKGKANRVIFMIYSFQHIVVQKLL